MIDRLQLPVPVSARDASVVLRRATRDDLGAIMHLLSDDPISAGRGDIADPEDEHVYERALGEIVADPSNELIVAVNSADVVVATLQLTVIPGMSRRGSARLLVEAVRVLSRERSSGIGSAIMTWVIDQAAIELNTPLVQLTSDAARTDAHRFYQRLGFVDSHVGFKYSVPEAGRASR